MENDVAQQVHQVHRGCHAVAPDIIVHRLPRLRSPLHRQVGLRPDTSRVQKGSIRQALDENVIENVLILWKAVQLHMIATKFIGDLPLHKMCIRRKWDVTHGRTTCELLLPYFSRW